MADALFPKEVSDVLNREFMGFKVWYFLVLALLVPSPLVFIVVLIFLIPEFKEKVTELIRNGSSISFSRDSTGSATIY